MQHYFVSDIHFGHNNVIRYDGRPFDNIESHDNTIIENWNNRVTDNDMVYILGDISWYNVTKTIEILKKLKGRKTLIIGNHDGHFLKNKEFRECFEEITHYKELFISPDKNIVLSHYPMPCFKNQFHGWYHFYGHIHNSWQNDMMNDLIKSMENKCACWMWNVGIMLPYMNFTPSTFDEIIASRKQQ